MVLLSGHDCCVFFGILPGNHFAIENKIKSLKILFAALSGYNVLYTSQYDKKVLISSVAENIHFLLVPKGRPWCHISYLGSINVLRTLHGDPLVRFGCFLYAVQVETLARWWRSGQSFLRRRRNGFSRNSECIPLGS